MFITLLGCVKTTTTLSDTTTQPITVETTESDLTIQLKVIYELAVEQAGFTGSYEEWLETVRGPQGLPGTNGQEVQLQVSSGFIQWKYINETTWTNLILLDSLRGETGSSGKEVLFRVDSNYIQWQYLGDASWTNLISLSTLMGSDGRETLFQVDSGYLQWKYEDDSTWNNLIELSTLIGPKGEQGLTGLDGKEIELRVNDSALEWRYVNTDTWYYLYDLTVLKGEDAKTPVIIINEEGYWVIDGVVQPIKAYQTVQYEVDFTLNGGLMPDEYPLSVLVDKGNSMSLPIPERVGYNFLGWMTGNTVNDVKFNDYLPVTKDMTLYASWEVDTSLITDYFDRMNQNHGFDYTFNLDVTDGTNNYYYDIENYYYQNINGVSPYNYLESQTAISVPFMSSSSYAQKRYTVYDPELSQYVTVKTGKSSLIIEESYFVEPFNHYLGDLNPSLFTLSESGLLYDYYGNTIGFIEPFTDMMILYGIDLQSEFDYLDEGCILDLNTNTLTYNASGSFTVETYGDLSFNLTVVYEFIDYDELTMNLPVTNLKQIIVSQIDTYILYLQDTAYYDYIYPESLSAFESLVLDKKTLLNSIDNVLDIAYFYQNDIPDITFFEFNINDDLMVIDGIVNEMDAVMSSFSMNATQASIDSMTLIYNNYLSIITNLTSTEIYDGFGEVYYYDFVNEIKAAQYLDINKIFLSYYKIEKSFELARFTALYDTFVNQEEFLDLMDLIDLWSTEIISQATVELVDATYNNSITALTSFAYENNNDLGVIYMQTEDLKMNLTYNYYYLVSDQVAYTDYLELIATDLYTQTDMYQWVLDAIEFIQLANQYVINDIKVEMLSDVLNLMDELSLLLSEEDYLSLQTEYDLLMTLLDQLTNVYDYQNLYDIFIENTSKIPYDPWVVMKGEAIDLIEEEYLYLSAVATSESQIDLLGIYNAFNIAIEELLKDDEAGLTLLLNDTLSQFELAFDVASEYETLYFAKEEYLTLWENFYQLGVPYVDLSIQSIDDLKEEYLYYRSEIIASTTVIDIIDNYNLGRETLAYFNIGYLDISVLNDTYIGLVEDYLNAWVTIFLMGDVVAISYCEDFVSSVTEVINPYLTVYLYEQYMDMLGLETITMMQSEYEGILNCFYNDYSFELDPMYYPELDILYNQALDAIYAADSWDDFDPIISGFIDQVSLLTTT